jgi:hypothetical protein
MTTQRIYLSTTIPYVNARPHLGFALELVQADVLARHHRLTGDQVRFQTGTDDNSLKNVLAAEAQGIGTAELVDRNAAAFAALREPLSVSFDDFIRTGSDPRHLPGGGTALARVRSARRPVPEALRGLVLRGLRAVLQAVRAAGWPVPRTRDRAAAGRREELVLPPVPARRPATRPDQFRQAQDRACGLA